MIVEKHAMLDAGERESYDAIERNRTVWKMEFSLENCLCYVGMHPAAAAADMLHSVFGIFGSSD